MRGQRVYGVPPQRAGTRRRPRYVGGIGERRPSASRRCTVPRLSHCALAVGGGVGRRGPQPFQFLVEPRRPVSEQPAMSRLVTSSPTSGSTTVQPASREQRRHRLPDHEQFLVLGATQTVEDHSDTIGRVQRAVRRARRSPAASARSAAVGSGWLGHPGLAVDAEPEVHRDRRHREQRTVGAGHRAAGEGDTRACGSRSLALRGRRARPRRVS